MRGTSHRLNVVQTTPGAVPTLAERISRLQAEARVLASDQVEALLASLADVERLGAEVSAGGEAFPVGVREIARRLAVDAEAASATINAIRGRQ